MTHRDGFPRFAARSAWRGRCGASQAMRDAVRKPWETAVPVAQANRQWAKRRRASESLDDAPQDAAPRLVYDSGPGGPIRRHEMGPYQRDLVSPPSWACRGRLPGVGLLGVRLLGVRHLGVRPAAR